MAIPAADRAPRQGNTRARLFAALAELRRPATTGDLAARLGLHPNGVRRHLERLHHDGLVDREHTRGLRGRPRDLWSPSAASQAVAETGAEAYVDLARWLARAIPSRPGRDDEVQAAGRRIGRELAPDEAVDLVDDLLRVLEQLGFRPSIAKRDGNRAIYRLGRCPYAESVKENPQIICTLHRGITEGLLDRMKPEARMTRFMSRDPDRAGCEIEVHVLTAE